MPEAKPAKKTATKKPMRIWERVCTTDPAHTRRVNQRGGFTAIDQQWQLQQMTEVFGPKGEGWGHDHVYELIHSGDDVVILLSVSVWWRDEDKNRREVGPVTTSAGLLVGGRWDHDAPKKALTDALTKSLSHIGMSADVFLGKFDDNKYVESLRSVEKATPDQVDAIRDFIESMDVPDEGMKKLLLWAGVDDVTELPADKAKRFLEKRRDDE